MSSFDTHPVNHRGKGEGSLSDQWINRKCVMSIIWTSRNRTRSEPVSPFRGRCRRIGPTGYGWGRSKCKDARLSTNTFCMGRLMVALELYSSRWTGHVSFHCIPPGYSLLIYNKWKKRKKKKRYREIKNKPYSGFRQECFLKSIVTSTIESKVSSDSCISGLGWIP